MDIDTARLHIDEAERVGAELAGRYLDELDGVTGVGVVMGSGRPLPELERILPVHALLHAAEGVLFREVIVAAANERGVPVVGIPEKEVRTQASAQLGLPADRLDDWLADLGKAAGKPWTQDQKLAALVAWLALGQE